MSSSTVPVDDTRLSRVDRLTFRLESALNLASGIVIFTLVLLATVNVIGRKLFNAPVPGFVDWVEQFMAVFVFVGLAYCQREGGHIRMEVLIGRLRGRALWVAEFLSILLMLPLTLVLAYGSWSHFLRSFDPGSPLWSRDSSIDVALPLWPAKLIVPLSMLLLAARLALQLWAYGRAMRSNASRPAAVPILQDTASQAAREVDAVEGKFG